jgi:hypothetical protein
MLAGLFDILPGRGADSPSAGHRLGGSGWLLAASMALVAVGCGRVGTDRCALTGSVTLAGKPIDGGNIQIEPLDVKQTSASGALIQQGRYAIPRETGLAPGKYRVRIYCAETTDAKIVPTITGGPQNAHVGPPKELIPAKYNAESQLTIEVRQGGGNTFDFALER